MIRFELLLANGMAVAALLVALLQEVPDGWPAVFISFFGLVTLIVNSYVVIATMKHAKALATMKQTLHKVDQKVDIVDEKATETVVMSNHATTVMREQAVDSAQQLLQLQPGDQSAIDRLKRAEEALATQVKRQEEAIAAAKLVGARSIYGPAKT